MSSSQFVVENIVSCRNMLLGGRVNDNIIDSLHSIIENLDKISSSDVRELVAFCVVEVIDQVKCGYFVSAGRILNLIHNIPLDGKKPEGWSVDYFLSIELAGFLEYFDEIRSARVIVFGVVNRLAGFC